MTQDINKEGNLVSVANMNTQESTMGENVTIEDIKSELFEGENIVTNDKTDKGLSNLTNAV